LKNFLSASCLGLYVNIKSLKKLYYDAELRQFTVSHQNLKMLFEMFRWNIIFLLLVSVWWDICCHHFQRSLFYSVLASDIISPSFQSFQNSKVFIALGWKILLTNSLLHHFHWWFQWQKFCAIEKEIYNKCNFLEFKQFHPIHLNLFRFTEENHFLTSEIHWQRNFIYNWIPSGKK
jgi:hypothetical protein